MTDAIFTRSGENAVTATPYAAGPWHPELQHGGAPSALCVWAAEQVAAPGPMRVARVTVELLRPVPVGTLTFETDVVRAGRKIQLVQVRLLAAGTEVTRALVLRVRTTETALPEDAAPSPPGLTPHALAAEEVFGPNGGARVNFGANFEIRRERGGFGQLGPGRVWFRQHRAVVEGATNSAAMRAIAVADFSNGIAPVLPFADWTFLNADLTLHLAREPEGAWIFSDAETWASADGIGVASTRLADERGWFGRAAQTLLLERR